MVRPWRTIRLECLEDTAPGAGQLAVGNAEALPGNHHALATACLTGN